MRVQGTFPAGVRGLCPAKGFHVSRQKNWYNDCLFTQNELNYQDAKFPNGEHKGDPILKDGVIRGLA